MPFIKTTTTVVFSHRFAYGLLIVLLVVLSLLQLILANRLASHGREVGKIEETIKELQQENQILENQKASLVSLTRIAEESKILGLVAPQNIVYITAQTPVAYGN